MVRVPWVVCAERYLTVGGGSYDEGIFVPLLLAAVGLSGVAGFLAVRAWRSTSGGAVAAVVTVPAVAAVLILALAIGLRG